MVLGLIGNAEFGGDVCNDAGQGVAVSRGLCLVFGGDGLRHEHAQVVNKAGREGLGHRCGQWLVGTGFSGLLRCQPGNAFDDFFVGLCGRVEVGDKRLMFGAEQHHYSWYVGVALTSDDIEDVNATRCNFSEVRGIWITIAVFVVQLRSFHHAAVHTNSGLAESKPLALQFEPCADVHVGFFVMLLISDC